MKRPARPAPKKAANAPAGKPKAATPAVKVELKPYTESIPDSEVKFDMAAIPAGKFAFADPAKGGKTAVVPVGPLWMSRHEVTWDAYDIFAYRMDLPDDLRGAPSEVVSRPSKPYGAPDEGFGHQGYPALRAAWESANVYCRWLSEKTKKKYRLPTEAEWEYACRAGDAGAGPSGPELEKVAWIWDNADDKTHAVGTRAANAWGLFDMLGNTSEWVRASDGTGVVRGGSWKDRANKVNYSFREKYSEEWQARDAQRPKSRWWLSDGPFVGFRVVRDP